MTVKYFNVKNGLTTGNISLNASNSNVTANTFIGNLAVTQTANLGNVSNLHIVGGSSGQVLGTDGLGNLSWKNSGMGNLVATMPTYIATSESYTVQANFQGLYGVPITIDGELIVDGTLVEVINIHDSLVNGVVFNDGNGYTSNAGFTFVKSNTTLTVNNFVTTSTANLGSIGNIKITGGDPTQVLSTDGAGNLSWVYAGGGGGGSPGGSNTQVQFNYGGLFAGNTGFTFNKTTGILSSLYLAGNGNGLSNIQGSNVSGAVGLATYATTANSVAGSNVSGQVANALVAGTVYSAAQGNITSVGTLTSLSVSGTATTGNLTTGGILTVSGTSVSSISGNLNMNSKFVVSVSDPVNLQDVATKNYVDTKISSGINYHQPVNVATTTTLAVATSGTTAYYSPNGAANGIGAYISTTGTFTLIDTVNIATIGTRILVKDEANAIWNGVYTYANATAIIRSTDADEYGSDSTEQLSINDYFFTQNGVTNKGTSFIVSAPTGIITFGTSNITFSIFSSSQTYSAGTGLTLTSTVFSVDNSQPQITAVGTLTSLSISGNANVGNIGANNAVFTSVSGNGSSLSSITGANVTGAVAFATTANAVAGANVSGAVAFATTANSVAGANVSGQVNYAAVANSVAGANVIGEVAYATTANSVAGSNVTGAVGLATYATTANSVAGGNVSGQVNFAATANSVVGSNVTGAVSYATTANSVAGSNVTGAVAYATTANSVAGANVSGQVSNALIAGTVYTNAQPNITSTGTLASLSVSGNANVGTLNTTGQLVSTVATGTAPLVVTSTTTVANLTAAVATVAGTVTAAAQGNITSLGTLNSLSVSGNANVGNIGTAGQFISSVTTGTAPLVVSSTTTVANLAATTAGTVTTNAQPNITSTGTLVSLSVTGNITAGGTLLPRIVAIADGTSVTMNGANTDTATQTNTQVAGTLTINAPSGTPYDGQKLVFRLQSSNVQTFSWNSIFAGSTDLSLPTTSSGSSKYDYVGFIYNTPAVKWQLLAKNFGF